VSGRRAFIADGYPGIIEVTVAGCLGLFADGFETGDTTAWSGAGEWEPPAEAPMVVERPD